MPCSSPLHCCSVRLDGCLPLTFFCASFLSAFRAAANHSLFRRRRRRRPTPHISPFGLARGRQLAAAAAGPSARFSPLLSLSFLVLCALSPSDRPSAGSFPLASGTAGFLVGSCASLKKRGEVNGGGNLCETRRRTTLRQNKRRRKCERGGQNDGRIAGKGLARGERASFILFKDTGQTGDSRQAAEGDRGREAEACVRRRAACCCRRRR